MSIIDKLWFKYNEWKTTGESKKPNAIIMPPEDFLDFQKYFADIEFNSAMPLPFLKDMQIFSSTGATEIKMGIMI